jgi:hypothetical protein
MAGNTCTVKAPLLARLRAIETIRDEPPMKTNVTLKLDADLLREARVLAAEEGQSISALLTDRLATST